MYHISSFQAKQDSSTVSRFISYHISSKMQTQYSRFISNHIFNNIQALYKCQMHPQHTLQTNVKFIPNKKSKTQYEFHMNLETQNTNSNKVKHNMNFIFFLNQKLKHNMNFTFILNNSEIIEHITYVSFKREAIVC